MCHPGFGQNLWISPGWSEDTQELIEAAWKDLQWEVSLDGREIDLPAFGTYDFEKDGAKRAHLECLPFQFVAR